MFLSNLSCCLVLRYRFRRDSVDYICTLLKDDLTPKRATNQAFPVKTKVLAALRVLATGGFQYLCGNAEGMSQSSVCRHFHAVIEALVGKLEQFVAFRSDPVTLRRVAKGFFSIAGFPNVVGCIDGTHIPIFRPEVDPEHYVNRKGYHSINVQVTIMLNKLLFGVDRGTVTS